MTMKSRRVRTDPFPRFAMRKGTRTRILPVFALLVVTARGVIAQEREFPAQNCAITPAAGWHEITNVPPQEGRCAVFNDAADTRLLLILADSRLISPFPLNDHFGANFEQTIEGKGFGKFVGKRVSGNFIGLGGIKCYERLGEGVVNGRNASTIVQFVPVDGMAYELIAIRFEGDANHDQEIRKTLASFRFIKPPTPAPPPKAYATGYFMGQLLGWTVLGPIAVAVIRFIFRRTGSTRRQAPPKLPQ